MSSNWVIFEFFPFEAFQIKNNNGKHNYTHLLTTALLGKTFFFSIIISVEKNGGNTFLLNAMLTIAFVM